MAAAESNKNQIIQFITDATKGGFAVNVIRSSSYLKTVRVRDNHPETYACQVVYSCAEATFVTEHKEYNSEADRNQKYTARIAAIDASMQVKYFVKTTDNHEDCSDCNDGSGLSNCLPCTYWYSYDINYLKKN